MATRYFSIVSRYQVQPATIKQLNRLRSNVVSLGKKLLVTGETRAAKRTVAKSPRLAKAEPSYVVVNRGDTLASIARRFKVGVQDLQRWNKISKRGTAAGTRIIVAKND